MAATKMLAPEVFEGIEIKDPDATEDTWEQFGGITDLQKAVDSEEEDVADFDSDGHGEDLTTQRTVSYEVEAFALIDPDTGEHARGQEIILEAAEKVGYASRVTCRVLKAGNRFEEFTANIDLGNQGGGVTGVSTLGMTLTATGWPTKGTES